MDSTGLEVEHASRYFRWRKSEQNPQAVQSGWPKLTIACHRQSQLILAADLTPGPTQDAHLMRRVLRQANMFVRFSRILADRGYDSEKNHVFCRESLGIPSTIIPVFRRGRTASLKCHGYYRRQMKRHFPKHLYGQRWQVESVFSRFKRRFGPQLVAHSWLGQVREASLKVITYNLLILVKEFA